jgi:hypothetical protein
MGQTSYWPFRVVVEDSLHGASRDAGAAGDWGEADAPTRENAAWGSEC